MGTESLGSRAPAGRKGGLRTDRLGGRGRVTSRGLASDLGTTGPSTDGEPGGGTGGRDAVLHLAAPDSSAALMHLGGRGEQLVETVEVDELSGGGGGRGPCILLQNQPPRCLIRAAVPRCGAGEEKGVSGEDGCPVGSWMEAREACI